MDDTVPTHPQSPDFKQIDFFLLDYLKKREYNTISNSLDSLKANIKREFKEISKKILTSVFNEFLKRIEKVNVS